MPTRSSHLGGETLSERKQIGRQRTIRVAVCGLTNSGKSEVINGCVRNFEGSTKGISATTRPKREGEKEGQHYFFLTDYYFCKKIRLGKLFENTIRGDYRYGLPNSQLLNIPQGEIRFFNLDLDGIEKFVEQYPGEPVFLIEADKKDLKARLHARDKPNKDRDEREAMIDEELKRIKRSKKRLKLITIKNPNGQPIEVAIQRMVKIIQNWD